MSLMARLVRLQRRLARIAYARRTTKIEIERAETVEKSPPPSMGAVATSFFGLFAAPCAVLADYYLLSAVIDFVVGLSSTGDALYARILVPVAVTLIDLIVSLRRSLERIGADANVDADETGAPWRWVPLIAPILIAQVAAAGAQFVALEASSPSPANGLVMLFLGAVAVVTHIATLMFAGDSILLLATACQQHLRQRTHARLTRKLLGLTRRMLQAYRAWAHSVEQHREANPSAPALQLDPVIIEELRDATGTGPAPSSPPSGPLEPPPQSTSPYTQFDAPGWGDEQRM